MIVGSEDFELMRLGDCFETPEGLVLAGTSVFLDELPRNELNDLLRRLQLVAVSTSNGASYSIRVSRTDLNESVSGKRNVFLLVASDTPVGVADIGASVTCPRRVLREVDA